MPKKTDRKSIRNSLRSAKVTPSKSKHLKTAAKMLQAKPNATKGPLAKELQIHKKKMTTKLRKSGVRTAKAAIKRSNEK